MRFWEIEGYDSLNKIYERKVPVTHLGEKQVVVEVSRCKSRIEF